MKLTKRDKQLLIVLLIFGIVALYYQFVYLEQSSKLKELYDEKTSKELKLIEMRGKVAKLPAIDRELEEEKKDILPLVQKYLGDVNQEDLILMINDFESKSSIKIKEVSFSEVDDFDLVSKEETVKNETTTSEQAQGNTDESSQATTDTSDTDQEKVNLDNIKMTNTEINFRGSYADISKFIKILDESSKSIVSNKLSIKKSEAGEGSELAASSNPQDYVEGSLNLQFFRVYSVEKYAPTKESILVKNPVKKTNKTSPFIGYKWAIDSLKYYDKTTGRVTRTVTDKEEINSIINNGANNIDYSLQGNSSNNVAKKSVVEYKKPVELLRFDSMNDFSSKSEDENAQINLQMSLVENLNYKIIKADIEYDKDVAKDKKVMVDLSKKMLKLQDRPSSLMLNLYSSEDSGYEIGLVFSSNGEKKYIPFNSKLTFVGWKELELDTSGVTFPANIDGIYMKGNVNDDKLTTSIYIDSLYANYVQMK